MRSRRTQQQLLPHTHFHRRISRARTRAPPVRACKWKWMSVTPQGGQRSAEMHSGTSLRRLRSRCVAPASRRSPRACLCWGNTILSFRLSAASEGGRVTFPVPLCLSIPAGSFLPTRRLYRGRTQPETQDEIQGGEFADSQLCKNGFHLRPLWIKTVFHLRSESSECKSQLFHFIPNPIISAHPTTCFLRPYHIIV